jgi:hypothetical protein
MRDLKNAVCLTYQQVARLGAPLSAADLHDVMGDPFVGTLHPCKVCNILRLGVPFLHIGPPQSHITEILPPRAAGDWAHVFRHGNAESVTACSQQCSQAGARRFEEAMCLAREFSSARLVPRLKASLKTAATAPGREKGLESGAMVRRDPALPD